MQPRLAILLSAVTMSLLLCAGAQAQTPTNCTGNTSCQCDVTGSGGGSSVSACTGNGSNAITNDTTKSWCGVPTGFCEGTYIGARTDPGTAGPAIDAWNYCRYVDNTGGNSIFVPFNSYAEWIAFINNKPGYINLVTCSRPGTLPIPDDYPTYPNGTPNPFYDPNYACDAPQTANANMPYSRTGLTVRAAPVQFTCNVPGQCDSSVPPNCGANQQWTETATATFTAGAASDGSGASSGWALSNVAYAGNPPVPSPPNANNGQCGSASGVQVSSAPTSGLCSVGMASAMAGSGSGPYTWTCSGVDGGQPMPCSTSMSASCGPATTAQTSTAPSTGLCNVGTPSSVTGNGPWNWTCSGIDGSPPAACTTSTNPCAAQQVYYNGDPSTQFSMYLNLPNGTPGQIVGAYMQNGYEQNDPACCYAGNLGCFGCDTGACNFPIPNATCTSGGWVINYWQQNCSPEGSGGDTGNTE
jgi:hypothetical protein